MGVPGTAPARAYSWHHVAFALGIGALAVSFAAGLFHAFAQEGRLPAPSLDAYSEAAALEARGDLRKALRRYEISALVAAGDAEGWKRVAGLAARAGDLAAEIRARRWIASLERRSPQAQLDLAAALLRGGRVAEAEDAHRRALELESRNSTRREAR